MKLNTTILIFFLLNLINISLFSQNRFQSEVNSIQKKYTSIWDKEKETIVFTGSSSIRLWKNLDSLFPNKQIINTGFGASLSGDLLHFTEELILEYKPTKVFIYEGDNDIAYEKKAKEVLQNMEAIIHKIKKNTENTQIILISAKPSLKRWYLKKQYKRLNRKLKRITKKDPHLYFADVWKPMLKGKKINATLFSSDNLHMNAEGYKIWYKAMKPYIN